MKILTSLLLFCAPLAAQITTGTIVGTVTDPTGAVVAVVQAGEIQAGQRGARRGFEFRRRHAASRRVFRGRRAPAGGSER